MSKTYRRKGVKSPFSGVSFHIFKQIFGRCWWRYTEADIPPCLLEVYKKKGLARFHSDAYYPKYDTGNASAEWRRMKDNQFREACRRITRNINIGDYDNYVYPLHKKDSGYDYR